MADVDIGSVVSRAIVCGTRVIANAIGEASVGHIVRIGQVRWRVGEDPGLRCCGDVEGQQDIFIVELEKSIVGQGSDDHRQGIARINVRGGEASNRHRNILVGTDLDVIGGGGVVNRSDGEEDGGGQGLATETVDKHEIEGIKSIEVWGRHNGDGKGGGVSGAVGVVGTRVGQGGVGAGDGHLCG